MGIIVIKAGGSMSLLGGLVLAVPMIAIYFLLLLLKKTRDKLVEAFNIYKYKRELNYYYKDSSKNKDIYEIRSFLKSINDREFEYFCANLWCISKGYKATLTQKSRDGGKDVILRDENFNIGYIECKHYAENNNVGIAIAQRLLGAMSDDGADFGVLMTTGRVSSDAWKRSDRITIMDTDTIVGFVGKMSKQDAQMLVYNTKKRIVI